MQEQINLLETAFSAACTQLTDTGSYQGFWDILFNPQNFKVAQVYQREQIRLERIVTLYRGLLGSEIELLTDAELLTIFDSGKTAAQIQAELELLGINTTKEDAICQVLGGC